VGSTPEIAVTPPAVLQIVRVVLNVTNLQAACAFYTDALGFFRAPAAASEPRADVAVLRLGREVLELRVTGGRPYPEPRAANDPWFQHFAIAVSDMDQAYGRLSRYAEQPVSVGGPQLLPPSTGSVTAYKFRDPDGHPLELSYIPGSAWLSQGSHQNDELCLGIDHSALAVSDLAASIAFYRDVLGFIWTGQGLNRGPEQDRLDGLERAQVNIASLNAVDGGPHIELLNYRSPRPAAASPMGPRDIAATRLVLHVADMRDIEARLAAAKFASVPLDDRARLALQDPDGHWMELSAAPGHVGHGGSWSCGERSARPRLPTS
jgi:catechol 2,3-dioxygenase-like lactoylglutathione lyase family enzyme